MCHNLIVGSRGSKLAITQTKLVIEKLLALYPQLNIEIKIIKTTGDKILDVALNKIGGKNLFIKEIEESLLNKEIDFAVHSLKDMPHTLPDEFQIAAILTREMPNDVLILKDGYTLASIPAKSTIATSSLRRKFQLLNLRPDLTIESIRGNVDSRINKLINSDYIGTVLASAGLKRLGWSENSSKNFFDSIVGKDCNIHVECLPCNKFIPAVGQGALALEIRKNDDKTFELLQKLNNSNDQLCITVERLFLKEINGSCQLPVGAYAELSFGKIILSAMLGGEKTTNFVSGIMAADKADYKCLAVSLANRLKKELEDTYGK